MLLLQVIGDMVDEIVHGILKKGFLQKKGHKRKNWKRRWFVLHRTIIKYFETRDNLKQKVSGGTDKRGNGGGGEEFQVRGVGVGGGELLNQYCSHTVNQLQPCVK